jgi:hypothetical protein
MKGRYPLTALLLGTVLLFLGLHFYFKRPSVRKTGSEPMAATESAPNAAGISLSAESSSHPELPPSLPELDFTNPSVFKDVLFSMDGQAIPELRFLPEEVWSLAASFSTDEGGVLKAFRNYSAHAGGVQRVITSYIMRVAVV